MVRNKKAHRKPKKKIEKSKHSYRASRTSSDKQRLHNKAYYEAKKKIEEIRRSGAVELDLSIGWYVKDEEKLTELPESLGKLTQLQSLDLSRNGLTTLPEWLGQLTQLRSLSLSRTGLITLPEWLRRLAQLQSLDLSFNYLRVLPEWLGQITQLQSLDLSSNQLTELPEWLGQLNQLVSLNLFSNRLSILPSSLGQLRQLNYLNVSENKLISLPVSIQRCIELRTMKSSANYLHMLPDSFSTLTNLEHIDISVNELKDLPLSLGKIKKLEYLELDHNPINPELAETSRQGLDAVKLYLRLRTGPQVILTEAKLILVGEGEVGKTCLMDALLGAKWKKHSSTHGIEIKPIKINNPNGNKKITLNGWDFGGQRIYRPTHQLFFSAPAVYLVVWKPREGPQQGFVKEWIQLIKRREPSAKILVVATHGGPKQRQPDIDRQDLWDLFSKETVVNFFHVESKPDKKKKRRGILELKRAIARVGAELPGVGRSVPKSFADVRAALQATGVPYLSLDEVLAICRAQDMDDEIARLFITISHRLGHLTHYENDPALRDIVILRPDWLATAMSYVLDDEETRNNQGLVKFTRLSLLWNDPARPAETRYPDFLHRIFMRLMERFDLSYRVAGIAKDEDVNPVSLIAQLVPDTTPEEKDFNKAWSLEISHGDIQQTQICRIVDAGNGQSANAEGLFYQLIVRLHKFSLGRSHWDDSVHWQRGLVLDADYNGRALLRHIGNDVHITVRAAFPERFLGMLTEEVKYLVESFWEGLRCDVTVPCLTTPDCKGLFEVSKLIENKKRNRHEQPCPICNEWQSIEQLLSNAPAATQTISLDVLMKEFAQVKDKLDEVNDNTRRILSQVDKQYADLIQIFTDEAKEGPRLFSLFPLDGNKFNPKNWIRHQFRLVLWCEHSRLPLPMHNDGDMKTGVYDFELDQDWFKKTAPYLKLVASTLSLVLPVASSTLKVMNNPVLEDLQNQIGLGKDVISAIAGESAALNEFSNVIDAANMERGVGSRAENATLRELHALLKAKDPGFGGLVRVLNKRNEFLWVHEKYAGEY